MINIQSVLKVADNSGAILAKCIQLKKASKHTGANVGDVITVVIKKNVVKKNVKKSKEVKRGQVINAVVLCTKFSVIRWGGFFIKSYTPSVALLNKSLLPIGTRINGLAFNEIKQNPKLSKLSSLVKVLL